MKDSLLFGNTRHPTAVILYTVKKNDKMITLHYKLVQEIEDFDTNPTTKEEIDNEDGEVLLKMKPDSKMIKLNDSDLVVAREDALILLRGSLSYKGELVVKRVQTTEPFYFRRSKEVKLKILKFEKSIDCKFLILLFSTQDDSKSDTKIFYHFTIFKIDWIKK